MAGSYLGHGAKYWADRYFESQAQTRLPDDPADLSWRDKYLALEKECSSYQATLADMRAEIEYLRNQKISAPSPDPALQYSAEHWKASYWRLYRTFREKENQLDALSAEKQHIKNQLQTTLNENSLYQGKTAEQWAELYFSEQRHTQSLLDVSKKKDSDIQALNVAITGYKKFSEVEGHDAIYWHHKFLSLQKDSFSRRMFLMFVVFFFSFAAGITFRTTFTRPYVSSSSSSSQSSSVRYSASLTPTIEPQTGIFYSSTSETNDVSFQVVGGSNVKYYLCLCQGKKIIKSYYIRAGETLSAMVPSGGYTIYFASAPSTASWFGVENLWGTHTSYYQLPNSFSFSDASSFRPFFDFSSLASYDFKSLSESDWQSLS